MRRRVASDSSHTYSIVNTGRCVKNSTPGHLSQDTSQVTLSDLTLKGIWQGFGKFVVLLKRRPHRTTMTMIDGMT